jgi:prepilin-type N-terminal cleavage/methylation domain-containing protein
VIARLRTARGDERGMTLVELSIASAVMLIVVTTLVTTLVSMTRNDNIQQARVVNQEQVRQTLLTMSREIRSANPPIVQTDATTYATAFEALVGASNAVQIDVRWRLNGTTLVRDVMSNGTVSSTASVLTNVTSSPLFQYFDQSGTEITSAQAPADYVNCAIKVRINVTAAPDTAATPFTESNDVELRNRLPGGVGC